MIERSDCQILAGAGGAPVNVLRASWVRVASSAQARRKANL